MNSIELDNGLVKLTSTKGIIDTRNNMTYSEVICKEEDIKYFKEVE